MRITALTICLYLIAVPVFISAQTPLKPRDPSINGPQTFAIILGVSKYKFVRPLAYADKDAELFRDYLRSPGGGSVKEENIYLLLNENATNANFWTKGFQWLRAKNLRKGDKLFIYLAGHGDAIDEDQFFFLGYDCNPAGDKNNYLVAGTIQLFNLKKKISDETTKGVEVIFIMDACRSNELPGGAEGQNFLNSAVSEKRAGEIIMLATGAGQESLEDASIGNGHGLFTYYLVDGLTGVADNTRQPDDKVTFQEIKNYVDQNVPSVAQQRFRRKQDPYFCCNENSDKVISTIDTAYLTKWLKAKKQETRGGRNSFNGSIAPITKYFPADTLLVETYSNFYKAVQNKKITGNNSAEDYFAQLNKKFPGNPYTLDAKSTLAVEYVNEAQARVDEYLTCNELSSRQKAANYEAGLRLEKAIAILREDDLDFANSLRGRMYLLKASGDPANVAGNINNAAFQNAYAALAIDRNGAYIQNELALLHLENNRLDSAKYYAEQATRTAPKWSCAFTTLALIQNKAVNNNPADTTKKKKNITRKSSFGFTAGGGINQSNPAYQSNPNSPLIAADSKSAGTLNIGITYHFFVGKNISLRPEISTHFGNTEISFLRREASGGQTFRELLGIKTTFLNAVLPVLVRFNGKSAAPYIIVGPSVSFVLGQDEGSEKLLPVKKTIGVANAGFGVDITIKRTGFVISPEFKYSMGLTDMKENNTNTIYSNVLSSLKKQSYTLNIYLRKR